MTVKLTSEISGGAQSFIENPSPFSPSCQSTLVTGLRSMADLNILNITKRVYVVVSHGTNETRVTSCTLSVRLNIFHLAFVHSVLQYYICEWPEVLVKDKWIHYWTHAVFIGFLFVVITIFRKSVSVEFVQSKVRTFPWYVKFYTELRNNIEWLV